MASFNANIIITLGADVQLIARSRSRYQNSGEQRAETRMEQ